MTYVKENWEENKKKKIENNQILDGEKRRRNEEIYGLALGGLSIRKLSKRYGISRERVYQIISIHEITKNYKDNFGKLPTRYIRALVRGEVVSLEHAKLLGLEKLINIKNVGPMTAARILIGEYD